MKANMNKINIRLVPLDGRTLIILIKGTVCIKKLYLYLWNIWIEKGFIIGQKYLIDDPED